MQTESPLEKSPREASRPAPLLGALHTGNSAVARSNLPAQSLQIQSYPVRFSAIGGEYFRIWIVNLLLIGLTLGIYLPWAKVRKLRYFYRHTRIDDHPLDFHGEPRKMLRGTLFAAVFVLIHSLAASVTALASGVALLALLVVWPPLFRAAMQFRLANTSWRGLRFRFAASDLRLAYAALALPLALFLLPVLLIGLSVGGTPADGAGKKQGSIAAVLVGGLFLFGIALLPYFFWQLKRYQLNHCAWGPLRAQLRSSAGRMYGVFARTLGAYVLVLTGFAALGWMLLPSVVSVGLRGAVAYFLSLLPMLVLTIVTVSVVPKAYFMAAMQNLLWSRTGNQYARFKRELNTRRFIVLQCKNYVLIVVTLGLYWPFAVVATKRMQLEAISLKSRLDIDTLHDLVRRREPQATGDMAVDMLGLDIGM